MEQNAKPISYYLDILRRRKFFVIVPFVAVGIISLIVAQNLPRTYRSTATLLLEAPIPKTLVDSTRTDYLEDQMWSTTRKVMTANNIITIIKGHQLYPNSDTDNEQRDINLTELFKSNTEIALVQSDIIGTTRRGLTAIAFTISFKYHDPVVAKAIAEELATMFVKENDKERTERAEKATMFLTTESKKLTTALEDIDSRIAVYKKKYSDSLPEQLQLNLSSLDHKEMELRDTEQQLRITRERITFLTTELARAQEILPNETTAKAPLTKEEQLRLLQAEYLRLSSRYYPEHPDVARVKRQIEALSPLVNTNPPEEEIRNQLTDTENELRLLQEKYSGNHPEISRLKYRSEVLQQQLRNAGQHAGESPKRDLTLQSSSPAYLGVMAQVKASEAELEALVLNRDRLRSALEALQERKAVAPEVEKNYLELIRDRDRTLAKLNQLKEKLFDATLVETLEEAQHGQTLTIIERPFVPTRPENAIRIKVGIIGLFLGMAAGLGSALLVEFLDPRLRGYLAFREVTGLMPLVVIPYIESPTESEQRLLRRRHWKTLTIWTAVIGILSAGVAVSWFFLPVLAK